MLCEYLPTNLRVFPDARAAQIRHTVLRREATADAPGILEDSFQMAGFRDAVTFRVAAPVRLTSSAECVRFERESFAALHQMMAGLTEAEREAVWSEIVQELRAFQGANGFEGPCTLLVAGARKYRPLLPTIRKGEKSLCIPMKN